MADDDLRALSANIADYEHDILPAHERAAERLAALRVPAPDPEPPRWQKWLYWAGLWRLQQQYGLWARWEARHSRNYSAARFIVRLVIMIALTGVTYGLASHRARRVLVGYIVLYLVAEVVQGLRRIDAAGSDKRVRVAVNDAPRSRLMLANAGRIALFLVAFAAAVVIPHA